MWCLRLSFHLHSSQRDTLGWEKIFWHSFPSFYYLARHSFQRLVLHMPHFQAVWEVGYGIVGVDLVFTEYFRMGEQLLDFSGLFRDRFGALFNSCRDIRCIHRRLESCSIFVTH